MLSNLGVKRAWMYWLICLVLAIVFYNVYPRGTRSLVIEWLIFVSIGLLMIGAWYLMSVALFSILAKRILNLTSDGHTQVTKWYFFFLKYVMTKESYMEILGCDQNKQTNNGG